jgi:hypothetical protein
LPMSWHEARPFREHAPLVRHRTTHETEQKGRAKGRQVQVRPGDNRCEDPPSRLAQTFLRAWFEFPLIDRRSQYRRKDRTFGGIAKDCFVADLKVSVPPTESGRKLIRPR